MMAADDPGNDEHDGSSSPLPGAGAGAGAGDPSSVPRMRSMNELLSGANNRNHSSLHYGIPNLYPDFATAATVLRAVRSRLLIGGGGHDDDDNGGGGNDDGNGDERGGGGFEGTKLYSKTGMQYDEAVGRVDEFYDLLDRVESSLLEEEEARRRKKGEGGDGDEDVNVHVDIDMVVVEGLDGSGKSTLVSNLCAALSSPPTSAPPSSSSSDDDRREGEPPCPSVVVEAIPESTPPRSLAKIRPIMDCHGGPASRAFYVVSNYVLACEMRERLLAEAAERRKRARRVVFVVDRFYTSTVAYTVGGFECESKSSVPDEALLWPHDLPTPRLVLRIDVDDGVRIGRMDERREREQEGRERRGRGGDEGDGEAAAPSSPGDTNPWDDILRKKLDLGRRILDVVGRVCSVNSIPLAVLDGSLPRDEVARVASDAVRDHGVLSSALEQHVVAAPTSDDGVSGARGGGDGDDCRGASPLLRMARFAEGMGLCQTHHAVGGDDDLVLAKGVSWFIQIATTTAMMRGQQHVDATPPRLWSVDVLSLDEAGIVFGQPAIQEGGNNGRGECHHQEDYDGAPASFAWVADDGVRGGDDDSRRFGRGGRQLWGGEGVLWRVPDGLLAGEAKEKLYPSQLLPEGGQNGQEGEHDGGAGGEGGGETSKDPEREGDVVGRAAAAARRCGTGMFRFIPHRCWVSIVGGGGGSTEQRLEWNRCPSAFDWTSASSPSPSGRIRPSPGATLLPPSDEITLAIFGPHTAGKRTVGKKVAQLLGWKFRDELGDVLRCRESRGAADRHQIGYDVEHVPDDSTTAPAGQPPSAGPSRSRRCWDEVIFDEEARRDEEDAPISRVVETWHVGNLCWALQRRRHSPVSSAGDTGSPYASVDDDGDLRKAWINRTSHLVEEELKRKHVILVHLDVSAETMLRRRRSYSTVAELPFREGSDSEEAARLRRALVGRAEELLQVVGETKLADMNLPLLRLKNDEDGDEAIASVVRRICTYAQYHIAFVKSAYAR